MIVGQLRLMTAALTCACGMVGGLFLFGQEGSCVMRALGIWSQSKLWPSLSSLGSASEAQKGDVLPHLDAAQNRRISNPL